MSEPNPMMPGEPLEDSSSGADITDIPTEWPEIRKAHNGGPDARAAQERIMNRYGPAIWRYLNVLTRDFETTSELLQQFAKNLVEGRMKQACPERGKFRNYLKATLINLYHDHCRKQAKTLVRFTSELPELYKKDESRFYESDREFLAIWRNELIKSTLEELLQKQRKSGRPHHTVLELRLHHPDVRTRELTRLYAEETKHEIGVSAMRKLLHEARKIFADSLLRIVEETLDHPGLHEVEEELIELGLLSYCKEALNRRRNPQGAKRMIDGIKVTQAM